MDKSTIKKHTLNINGASSSVSVEEVFWSDLKSIAEAQSMTVSDLVNEINRRRQYPNLSSAIRLYVLDYFKNK